MKNIFLILVLSVLILSCTSCIKKGGKCELPDTVQNSGIVAIFKDVVGNYLYQEVNPTYNKDSLKVFDQDGISLLVTFDLSLVPNSTKRFYKVSFGPLYKTPNDQISFTNEVVKNYVVQYRHNERDTLKVVFKSKNTRCGSEFEYLKIYHKEELLTTVSNDVFAEIIVLKP